MKTGSVSSILQATVTNLQSKDIKQTTTITALKQIYEKLDEIIGLQSASVLQALTDTSMLENMQKEANVFASKNGKDSKILGKFVNNM